MNLKEDNAFSLRYLLANLGELKSRGCLAEFDINQRSLDIAELLLARNPKIIGFGISIWNVEPTTEVIAAIKRVRPTLKSSSTARKSVTKPKNRKSSNWPTTSSPAIWLATAATSSKLRH